MLALTLVFLVCGVVSALLAGALASAQEGKPKPIAEDLKPANFGVMLDHMQVEGPMACAECHPNAFMAWKESTHGKSFDTRHRSQKAKQILNKMGVKRFRAEDSLCISCHTTMQQPDKMEAPMAVAGPSCETCHGE